MSGFWHEIKTDNHKRNVKSETAFAMQTKTEKVQYNFD